MVVQNARRRKFAAPGLRGPKRALPHNSTSDSTGSPIHNGLTTQAQVFDADPHSDRRETIRRDISKRLRRICPDYTDDQFAELVDAMAERQLKGERRANRLPE